jgi:hypothetical protein
VLDHDVQVDRRLALADLGLDNVTEALSVDRILRRSHGSRQHADKIFRTTVPADRGDQRRTASARFQALL